MSHIHQRSFTGCGRPCREQGEKALAIPVYSRHRARSTNIAAGAALASASAIGLALAACAPTQAAHGPFARTPQAATASATETSAERCSRLAQARIAWPDPQTRIVSASFQPAGTLMKQQRGPGLALPEHCEIVGEIDPRTAADGQHYAIRFHVRLPTRWNHRFLFQGGGGSDGDLGDATGPNGIGNRPALIQGYAVVSQDSGHSNETNVDPAREGNLVFGFDPEARRNYGATSLKKTNDAARALVRQFYGADPAHAYFYGCSKGGQEGMAFAQRYPEAFDGIVAASPGFSLPKAAVNEAWDTQQFASLAGQQPATLDTLARSFSDAQLTLVGDAVTDACDADDGARDGIVGAFAQCTTAKVLPQLTRRLCTSGQASPCLTPSQITVMEKVLGGARNARGDSLYAAFPWDPGIAAPGWRMWKIGIPGQMPALNVMLGGGALAAIFTTPPTPLAGDPATLLGYLLGFDFSTDAPKIFAVQPPFTASAWDDIAARSPDIAAFAAHGGKMIVPQGAADPVFSINDTIAWWNAVNARRGGHAADTVRVFPVPGMNHCAGGPATDRFDALDALVDWVEQGKAPAHIDASAGPQTPWPGRHRPLCPYPEIAVPTAAGSDTFVCGAAPGARAS
jgi:feruloyl esterase